MSIFNLEIITPVTLSAIMFMIPISLIFDGRVSLAKLFLSSFTFCLLLSTIFI